MTRKYFFSIFLTGFIVPSVFSQTKPLPLGKGIHLISVLGTGNTANEYYVINEKSALNYNDNNFSLTRLDQNLDTIKSVVLPRAKKYSFASVAFNGKTIGIIFHDEVKLQDELNVYDSSLHLINRKIGVLGNAASKFVAIPDGGFLRYVYLGNGYFRKGYQIECYDTQLNLLWTNSSLPGETKIKFVSNAFVSAEYVGSLVARKISHLFQYYILLQDRHTGHIISTTPLSAPTYHFLPEVIHYYVQENRIVIFGKYNSPSYDNYFGLSKGQGFIIINAASGETSYKLFPLNGFRQLAKQDDLSTLHNAAIHFGDFVRLNDGRIFAIGEQYRKGIISTGQYRDITVGDLILIEYTADYIPAHISIFPKIHHQFIFPNYRNNSELFHSLINIHPAFDVQFITKENDQFSVTFKDRNNRLIERINYTADRKFDVQRMTIVNSPTATNYELFRAKPGYIMILQHYFRRCDIRLEKTPF